MNLDLGMSSHSMKGSFTAVGSDYAGSSIAESVDGMDEERPAYSAPKVAQKEEKMVLYSKVAVLVVLLVAVSGMAAGAFKLLKNQEEQEFQAQVGWRGRRRHFRICVFCFLIHPSFSYSLKTGLPK